MKTKASSHRNTVDIIIAVVFAIMFVVALVQVAKGAWWHTLTAAVSGAISYLMFQEVRQKQTYRKEPI